MRQAGKEDGLLTVAERCSFQCLRRIDLRRPIDDCQSRIVADYKSFWIYLCCGGGWEPSATTYWGIFLKDIKHSGAECSLIPPSVITTLACRLPSLCCHFADCYPSLMPSISLPHSSPPLGFPGLLGTERRPGRTKRLYPPIWPFLGYIFSPGREGGVGESGYPPPTFLAG